MNKYNIKDIHFKIYYSFTFTFYTRKGDIKGNFPKSSILRGTIFAEAQIPHIGGNPAV